MFKNYILMTLRTLKRQKISSIIAILGLTLGITSSLLLYIYIEYQFSFEDFLPKGRTIHRLINRTVDKKFIEEYRATNSVPLLAALKIREDSETIKDMTILNWSGDMTLSVNGDNYFEDIKFIEDNFFSFIPFNFVQGKSDSFSKNSIILDKDLADKFFPDGDALGKEIILKHLDGYPLVVTGVVDIPENSHLYWEDSQAFLPMYIINELIKHENPDDLLLANETGVALYFEVKNNMDKNLVLNELNSILETTPINPNLRSQELQYEDFRDIHLFTKANANDASNPIYMIILLALLTIVLLIISISNSVSILTAQSINRTKEVGVRLVMGSSKKDLIIQFLTESTVLSFISLITSLILVELLLPSFENLTLIQYNFNYSPLFILFICLLTLTIGIITGLYPAFYLSSLKVVDGLKGKNLLKLGRSKKALLLTQFIFATIILIFSMCFNNEFKYLQKLDIGFNRDNLIAIYPGYSLNMEPVDKLNMLKSELKRVDGIKEVAYGSYLPFFGGMPDDFSLYSSDGETEYHESYITVGVDYFNTLGINNLEGEIKENSVVIMRSVTEYLSIEVGDLIELKGEDYMVSAIVDDYLLDTPLFGIDIKFHLISKEAMYFQIIKTDGNHNLKKVRNIWREFFPNRGFEYYLISDSIKEANSLPIVETIKKIMTITMVVTLFISSLGLFGLILHTVKQKNREIGIRKVLGANFMTIMRQFVGDSVKFIVAGVIIGTPLGAFLINRGLSTLGYPFPVHDIYRLSITSAMAIIIAGTLITSIMVLRAALEVPSKALRYE